jgi:hypothetical protein
VQALQAGLSVDVEKLDSATVAAVGAELETDLSPANAPLLNSVDTTVKLINANAVIGVVAKDSNNDGKIDVASGDKVGVACALCQSITDSSVFALPLGGSIGKVIDGPTPHNLNVGATFALAANTRALYPIAQFLNTLGGAAGDEIITDYEKILVATGVPMTPSVTGTAGTPGEERTPIGIRLEETKLLDLSAYMDDLVAPPGVVGDAASVARGQRLFQESCTGCHNVDQERFAASQLIPMKTIFPGDNPVNLGERKPPLNPLLNTADSIFDDKMVVVNASLRKDIRGIALPLLLDLARKPVFLHDNSVSSLEALFDASRGPSAPHAVYLAGQDKADVIAFLKSN